MMENSQVEQKGKGENSDGHLVGEVQLQPGPDVGAAEEVVRGGVLVRDAEDEGAALRAPEEVRAQAPVRQRRLRQLQHPPEVLCSGNSSIHFLLCPFFTTFSSQIKFFLLINKDTLCHISCSTVVLFVTFL